MGRSEIRSSGVERQSCNDQPPTGSKPLRSNPLSDTRCRGSPQAPLFSLGQELRADLLASYSSILPSRAVAAWAIPPEIYKLKDFLVNAVDGSLWYLLEARHRGIGF